MPCSFSSDRQNFYFDNAELCFVLFSENLEINILELGNLEVI